jgi:hypothetical protein
MPDHRATSAGPSLSRSRSVWTTAPSNFAFINSFSHSSLDILMIFDFDALDYSTELQERELILFPMIGLRDDISIAFAFLTRTLQIVAALPEERAFLAAGSPRPDRMRPRATRCEVARIGAELKMDQRPLALEYALRGQVETGDTTNGMICTGSAQYASPRTPSAEACRRAICSCLRTTGCS